MTSLIQHSRSFALAAILLATAGCRPDGGVASTGAEGKGAPAPAAAQSDITPEQATKEVNLVLQSVTRAAAAGDIATLDRHYAPDVHIIDRNGFTEGWDIYRAKHLEETRATLTKTDGGYRPGTATVKVAGNVAWASFPYEVTVDIDGQPTQIFGYGSVTLRHDGSAWQIVQTMTSGRPRKASDPTF